MGISRRPGHQARGLKTPLTKVTDKIAKILAPTGDNIIAVFFEVDGNVDVEREGPDDTYDLAIYLLWNVETDPEVTKRVATETAAALSATFEKVFKVNGKWQNVELSGCFPLSEEGMTVRQSRHLRKWHTDYLSLRAEPQQETLQQ